MTFLVDAEELTPGLIPFRCDDVKHRNGSCRIKAPKGSHPARAPEGAL